MDDHLDYDRQDTAPALSGWKVGGGLLLTFAALVPCFGAITIPISCAGLASRLAIRKRLAAEGNADAIEMNRAWAIYFSILMVVPTWPVVYLLINGFPC